MSESVQYTRLAFMLSLEAKYIYHHQMRFSLQGGCAGQQCRLDGLPTDKVYIKSSRPFCNEKTVSVIYILPPRQTRWKTPFSGAVKVTSSSLPQTTSVLSFSPTCSCRFSEMRLLQGDKKEKIMPSKMEVASQHWTDWTYWTIDINRKI